jgi:predicted DNA-binding protein YlxM (UPF0122 family)
LKVKLTQSQVEEAKKLHEEGWTYEELAEKYDVSRQCINYRVRGDRNFKQSKLEILTIENERLKTLLKQHGIKF